MLFDTNFLIQLSREIDDRQTWPARRFLHRRRAETHAISVISLGELAAGLEENEEARAFTERFRIVHLKPEIALAAADVDRELMAMGMRLGENDKLDRRRGAVLRDCPGEQRPRLRPSASLEAHCVLKLNPRQPPEFFVLVAAR